MRDEYTEPETVLWRIEDYIGPLAERIKLGVYSEERDGDLLAVLEEIERILR